MRRICSLLLAVLLLAAVGCDRTGFSAVASSYLGIPLYEADEKEREHVHANLPLSEMQVDTSDLGLTIAKARELLFCIEQGERSGTAAQSELDDMLYAFERYRTAASIAYVQYCMDVTDPVRIAEYERLSASLNELGCLLIDAELALSSDPALENLYDAKTVEQLMREDALHDLSVQPLLERERELIGCYDALGTMTVSYDGREWTQDEILTDASLSYNAFSELYGMYRLAFNEQADNLFLELIALRNEAARALGFDSYVEYGYASYMRDYSAEDAKLLSETVKRELVPLFEQMQEAFYPALMRLSCGTFSEEPTMDRVKTVLGVLYPESVRAWDYMVQNGLYDVRSTQNRMHGSFTTYFEAFGAPFLFTSWDDSYDMPTTVLHEFGHYAGYYLNGVQRMQSADPLDLAEIDSQGLELLAFSQYDILYGALADAARTVNLTVALYAVVTGCMEDEFQQYAYRTESVTPEMLNAEYARLASEYGLSEMGLTGDSWTEVAHTFRAPMYYISYSTSMLAALQLLVLADDDANLATEAYRSIVMRPIGATFRSTIRNAGLRDPFDTGTVELLTEQIGSFAVK